MPALCVVANFNVCQAHLVGGCYCHNKPFLPCPECYSANDIIGLHASHTHNRDAQYL